MTAYRVRALLLMSCLIPALLLGVPLMRAQAEPGLGFGPGYHDGPSNAVIHGVVATVEENAYSCHWGATEVTLKTGKGTFVVQMGPTRFLAQNNFSIARGDELNVRGFKFTCQGTTFLIARDVTKGGKTLTLRDALGVPSWAGRGMASGHIGNWGNVRGSLCCGCRCRCW
jgi:hypothetical protein